jgi:2-keto-4-pentenoate hydratase/2-oxohepta-3-ene-1,7-dioic acid hydratase in catechol pathway
MRLATVLWDGKPIVAVCIGDSILNLATSAAALKRPRKEQPPSDMLDLINRGSPALRVVQDLCREGARRLANGTWEAKARDPIVRPVDRIRFLAPIPRPKKNVICLGRNYAEHAREQQAEVPSAPVFFTKPPSCVIGPGAPVTRHSVTAQLDYEVELAVVIGRNGSNISRAKAYDYVFGYTILNDITARDLQRRHMQWFKGKDPHNLRIGLRVNGDVRQAASTGDMVFRIPELLEVLSAGMTLEPGDILATGTPSGVGQGFNPPRWLQVGDVVEAEIEEIGLLRNRIIAPAQRVGRPRRR